MNQTNEILTLVTTFIAGGIIGFILCHITLGRKKATAQQQALDKQKADLDQNQAELAEYKAKVDSHFTSSAELMGQVANSYQALYNHMADQSQSLLSETDNSPFPLLKTPSESEIEAPILDPEADVEPTPAEDVITEEDKDAAEDETESENTEEETKHTETESDEVETETETETETEKESDGVVENVENVDANEEPNNEQEESDKAVKQEK